MNIYEQLYTEDKKAFKLALFTYIFQGAQQGIIAGFFALYIMNIIGVREGILLFNLGASIGVLMIPVYKRLVRILGEHKRVITLLYAFLFVADAMVPIAVYFPSIAGTAAFMNGFVAAGASVLSATYIESYVMHLFGLSSRARLTSLKNTVSNIASAAALFSAYYYSHNVLITFLVTELFRIATIITLWLGPDITIPTVQLRNNAHFETKVVFGLFSVFFLQVSMRLYGPLRSKILEETFGQAIVSVGVGLSMIITVVLFYTLIGFTTKRGKIIRRTGWLMLLLSLFFTLSVRNKYFYALAAILSVPFSWLFIMSIRHYIIKKVPEKETTSVIYSVNMLNYAARFLIFSLSLVVVGGTPEYFLLSTAAMAFAVVWLALSKIRYGTHHNHIE